jgi:uncharacterized protein (UPF0335 family)
MSALDTMTDEQLERLLSRIRKLEAENKRLEEIVEAILTPVETNKNQR